MIDHQDVPESGRYMMGTKALSGGREPFDISRDEPDLCFIRGTAGDDYIGEWETGYGFYCVRFPRATTRELTAEEREYYGKKKLRGPQGQTFPALGAPEVALDALPEIPERA